MRRTLVLIAALAFVVGALSGVLIFPNVRAGLIAMLGLASSTGVPIGGEFSLLDHRGARVGNDSYAGRLRIVFFGFTHCPDVCPAGLQTMTAALDRMGPAADRFQPLFVTVDPERDGLAEIAAYVANFHPRLVGLTGTPAEIAAMLKVYRVFARKVENTADSAAYLMDHSAIIYVMDRSGRYLLHFSYNADPAVIAASLAALP